jgi:hypothetical protein
MTLVHSMLAGGDCIDDADLLRWLLGTRAAALANQTNRRLLKGVEGLEVAG